MASLRAPVASKSRSKRSKERIKSSTAAIYASVFALLISVVAVGYRAPQEVPSVTAASKAPVAIGAAQSYPQFSASDVVAADIAAAVASTTDLAVAGNVAQLAASARIQSQYSSSESDNALSKPTIVEMSTASRNISRYTAVEGDTVQSVAARFGISENTVRWSNDLIGDTIAVGKVLDILPRNGFTYVVKSGDTIDSIANKYRADSSSIVTFNDLEISGIKPGLKIIIPDGKLPANEQPGYQPEIGYGGFFRAGSVGNRYAFGNCTWYVYEKRAAIGRPVGSFWGNAKTWDDAARTQGYEVNNTPRPGSVLVEEFGFFGHVAFVESVSADSIVISEMNNYAYGGFNIINKRTISIGQARAYMYVH